ncbi:DNA-binding response regulator [Knoellia sp. CPCC 206450]|uniref:response regulator transcription factor n=1 Tax=Knoellia tibetensis TaxID=3404798 RepID=UPI003B42BDD2
MTPSARRPVTVAVVNDHELIVRGVAAMLEPFADRIRVVELDTQTTPALPVDVVLYDTFARTDLSQDDLDELAGGGRVGRLVLYTWTLSEDLIASARARGVHAALPKSLDGASLAEAVVRVHEGHLDLVTVSEEPVIPTGSWPGRDEGLTPREAEIVALVTSGLSNNEIAERTYLSINSVKSYIRSAYRTMGVTSRSQAVLWGIDHGMAPTRMRIVMTPDGSDAATEADDDLRDPAAAPSPR